MICRRGGFSRLKKEWRKNGHAQIGYGKGRTFRFSPRRSSIGEEVNMLAQLGLIPSQRRWQSIG
jgi:hypothetical protein